MSSDEFAAAKTEGRAAGSARIGAIDIGSNAMRLLAAEVEAGSAKPAELASDRAAVRLGTAAFTDGKLGSELRERAVAALRGFRERLDELGASDYHAVATSAVRDSKDGRKLVREAEAGAGVRISVIGGAEEARLTWRAVRDRLTNADGDWLLADLGGGSLELSVVAGGRIARTVTHPVGTVRLLETCGDANDLDAVRDALADPLEELAAPAGLARGAGMVAMGGNIEELARLAGAEPDQGGVRRVAVPDVERVASELAALSVDKRIERHELRPDRADVIVPAAAVYLRVAEIAGVDAFVVPGVGVKEGLILDLADRWRDPEGYEARLTDELHRAAIELGRDHDFDEPHAGQVTDLALQLFDQLGRVHRLPPVDRRVLLAGALLHDIGRSVRDKGHHKHSFKLIRQADLPGLDRHETLLAALVARYHRGARPKKKHRGFKKLGREGRLRVRRLGALMRLADGLDRGHDEDVGHVDVQVERDTVRLVLHGGGDIQRQLDAMPKRARLFERVFDVPVVAEAADGSA